MIAHEHDGDTRRVFTNTLDLAGHLHTHHLDIRFSEHTSAWDLIEQHDAEHFQAHIRRPQKDAPSRLDRIEAHHWVICVLETARRFASELYDWERWPAGSGSQESWQGALEEIARSTELASKALRGQHMRGGTSLLQDLGQAEIREPDVRPVLERRPDRGE